MEIRKAAFLSCVSVATLLAVSMTGCGAKAPTSKEPGAEETALEAPETEGTEESEDSEGTSASEEPVSLKFEDGEAQPILEFSDLRDPYYTNENSDILRYCVYVETDFDTDADGNADLVKVLMQVPRAAAEGNFKAATIYDPTPYGAGTVEDNDESDRQLYNPTPFDYDNLYGAGQKRVPADKMTTLEAAENADPESWNYYVPNGDGAQGFSLANSYDYYLIRGFAVAECGGIGTYGSEGFELCGMDLECDSHKCVVEWLAGNRVAYTDPYNNVEIEADWSNGNVAMTGCSYGGTLPYEVATTGVEGLKTIIPFAGIASWYDYTNSQGAPTIYDVNYEDYLAAYNSGAAYLDDDWTVINDDYASFLWQMSQDQEATNGDYAEVWDWLDYSHKTDDINCSALIVHGLNDFNVFTKQADLMAQAFEKAGQTFKLVLHQNGHALLDGIMVGNELWQEIMNKWLSHYLYDVDNGIENMPEVTVQNNLDGSFRTYENWRDFEYTSVDYVSKSTEGETSTVDTNDIAEYYDQYVNSTDDYGKPFTRDEYYLNLSEGTGVSYTYSFEEDQTIYGVPEIHVRMATNDVDMDGLMVSAMLIDTIDYETNFKAYMTKQRLYDTVPVKTIEKIDGGSIGHVDIKEYVQSNTTAKLITFGYTDLKNYGCGYDSSEYTLKTEEMNGGEYYDYTFYLQPTVYTVEKGHSLVLVITGWDPYRAGLDEDYNSGLVTESNPSRYTYSFTIDDSSVDFRMPAASGE